MRRCIGCKTKGPTWCNDCDLTYRAQQLELRGLISMLGTDYSEGHLVLTAHELMEFERLIGQTSLGKAAVMSRAYELLLEVEDHFTHTPICPSCKEHKMELEIGEPLLATCLGGCRL